MRKHLRKPWIWIAALLLFGLWLSWPQPVSRLARSDSTATHSQEPPAARDHASRKDAAATAPDNLPAFLPREAHHTITLILQDGPYPYRQDDGVFGNREGHLPDRPRGYYHEYTVDTPGLNHRGARRIVTGGTPPEAWYYTDDHYDSFRQFQVDRETRP